MNVNHALQAMVWWKQRLFIHIDDIVITTRWYVDSLACRRFQRKFRKVIFQLILVIDGGSISCKIVLKWMLMDLTGVKSTLVQVMAWCRQATSHCLNQCWPRSLSPYGIIRPQWVKQLTVETDIANKATTANNQMSWQVSWWCLTNDFSLTILFQWK